MPPRRENPPNTGFTKPISFEPKSSAGYLQTFCRNCDRKMEEHGSFWVIHQGTVRTCPEEALRERSHRAATQHYFDRELQEQERENCAPSKTVANMPRRDPPYLYAVEAEFQGMLPHENGGGEYDDYEYVGTGGNKPLQTPFGTEISFVDRDTGVSYPSATPSNALTPERASLARRNLNPNSQLHHTGHLVGAAALPSRSNHGDTPAVDDACYHTNPAVMGARRHQGKRMLQDVEVLSGANRHHNDSSGSSFILGNRR